MTEEKKTRPANPKQVYGDRKRRLDLVPPALAIGASVAYAEGAPKYGAFNWRESHVEAMTYIAAIMRHAYAYMDGEDVDPESAVGKLHLEGIAACVGILLDNTYSGTIIDNRPPKGSAPEKLRDPGKQQATTTVTLEAERDPRVWVLPEFLPGWEQLKQTTFVPTTPGQYRAAYKPRADLDKAENDFAFANGLLAAPAPEVCAAMIRSCPKQTCAINGRCSYPTVGYCMIDNSRNNAPTDDLAGLAARESAELPTEAAVRDARVAAGAFDVLVQDPPEESFVRGPATFDEQVARAAALDEKRRAETQANIDRMRADQEQQTQERIEHEARQMSRYNKR